MELNLRNILLAGIGTMAYTYEKSMAIIDDLVQKGELTMNEAKELNEELKKMDMSKMGQKFNAFTADALQDLVTRLNLATKQDIEELKERINRLENNNK